MANIQMQIRQLAAVAFLLALTACTYGKVDLGGSHYSQAAAIKGQGGAYKVGNPYKIMGSWYYPKEDYSYSEVGMASWYGEDFHAKKTANGENYDMNTLTAAHRTLPLPSIVKVTNIENGRSLVLRVNDRGPYAKSRIIDISKRGAQLLGFQSQGTTKVRVELLEKESRELKAALLGDVYDSGSAPKLAATPIKPMQISNPYPPLVNNPRPSPIKSYSKGSYFVQAGAYTKRESARNLGTQLDKFGESNVFQVDIDGQRFYRVRVGPFEHKQEAEVALAKVRNFGITNAKVVQD